MTRWKRDVAYAIGLLAFSVMGWAVAGTFVQKNVKVWAAYPSTYARIIFLFIAILSLLQLVRALRHKPEGELPKIWTKQALITVSALGLYVFIINKIGFLPATSVLCGVLTFSYSAGLGKFDRNCKRKLVFQTVSYALISIAMAVAMYVIFAVFLKAKLPQASLW